MNLTPASNLSPCPPLEKLPFDSVLIVSFGGPEGMEDVMPFLENVLRGKNVPRERMLEVYEHYKEFGGVSPINQQCRDLIQAIQTECELRKIKLPIYWGNRNWHPLLPDTLQVMAKKGHRRSLAFFTSMFSSYSGCRQYRENIADAQMLVGSEAPIIEKMRMGFNHPKFISAQSDCLRQALRRIEESKRSEAVVLFTAHSIPKSMADHCRYEIQLREAASLISEEVGHSLWEIVYQSRSGPPQQPWLEPDICDRLAQLQSERRLEHVVVQPLGFISDHIEVLFDLDRQAAQWCQENGVGFIRAATVGVHPDFVSMIVDLMEERLSEGSARPFIGTLGPSHDICPVDCCLYPIGAKRPTT